MRVPGASITASDATIATISDAAGILIAVIDGQVSIATDSEQVDLPRNGVAFVSPRRPELQVAAAQPGELSAEPWVAANLAE